MARGGAQSRQAPETHPRGQKRTPSNLRAGLVFHPSRRTLRLPAFALTLRLPAFALNSSCSSLRAGLSVFQPSRQTLRLPAFAPTLRLPAFALDSSSSSHHAGLSVFQPARWTLRLPAQRPSISESDLTRLQIRIQNSDPPIRGPKCKKSIPGGLRNRTAADGRLFGPPRAAGWRRQTPA